MCYNLNQNCLYLDEIASRYRNRDFGHHDHLVKSYGLPKIDSESKVRVKNYHIRIQITDLDDIKG